MNFKEIYIVIVLYKTNLKDSKTIETLKNIPADNINLMVFDNSPVKQHDLPNFKYDKFNIHYFSDCSNPGLSHAYNLALSNASNKNYRWLLLLDQDTTITVEYINEIISLETDKISKNIVSIMPKVISSLNHKLIAPAKMSMGGICRPVLLKSGVVYKGISGINSGTLLSVSFMKTINGFSSSYSLDMLDHWYFREIKRNDKEIYLLHSNIKQELSIFGNFEENLSISRYCQLLNAENQFVKEDGFTSLLLFKIRLFIRVLKQLSYKNNKYSTITFNGIFNINQSDKKN
jgi:glycosyltransferase involved in cell wall biosynthesis